MLYGTFSFQDAPTDPREIMNCYTPEQTPVLSTLARQFAEGLLDPLGQFILRVGPCPLAAWLQRDEHIGQFDPCAESSVWRLAVNRSLWLARCRWGESITNPSPRPKIPVR